MATFYGGKQLVETSNFTESGVVSEATLKTVPTGHTGMLYVLFSLRYEILGSGVNPLVLNRKFGGSSEIISLATHTNNEDNPLPRINDGIPLNAGDEIVRLASNAINPSKFSFYVEIYKNA